VRGNKTTSDVFAVIFVLFDQPTALMHSRLFDANRICFLRWKLGDLELMREHCEQRLSVNVLVKLAQLTAFQVVSKI